MFDDKIMIQELVRILYYVLTSRMTYKENSLTTTAKSRMCNVFGIELKRNTLQLFKYTCLHV